MRLILIVTLLSFGQAAKDVELIPLKGKSTPGFYADGSMDILLKNHDDKQNDSIGIYKAGTSNEWKNVITWKWVKDMSRRNNTIKRRIVWTL